MKKIILLSLIIGTCCQHLSAQKWSKEKAQQWYAAQQWPIGCNFIPSTAINQLEMWQAESFDSITIDRELSWAQDIGLNTMRVFLHDLAYQADPAGFKQRMDIFLGIASKHGIRIAFVIFDDCWNGNPKIGPQPKPIPGVHNSGWVQSPSVTIVNDPSQWARLEVYVNDILTTFSADQRILFWDLYNEPGNSGQKTKTLPLLKKVYEWARQANPSQPLTSGVWSSLGKINELQLSASDIITFHNYGDTTGLIKQIDALKKNGRPVICTEWMARTVHSIAQTHLPIFKREGVGCINWGFVSGKTQTIYPWGSKPSDKEPPLWFHDLLHKDGSPYKPDEILTFKQNIFKAYLLDKQFDLVN